MKKHSTISCLAIICQLIIGLNGFSQVNGPGIEILQQPVFQPVCAGEGTALSVQASGGGLSYQWQVFKRVGYFEDLTNAQGYSGVQTAQLHIASLSKSMNQYLYRCKISNGTGELYSEPAVTELKNALINFHPANGTGYVGDYHSFEVYASGAGLKFQWQVNMGAGFANMVDDSTYTGCKASILSISKLVKKMDGYQFRCIVSGKACEVAKLVSDPATLSVSTDIDPMKSAMGGDPSNVVWYINGMGGTPTFFGNPMVHVDGAIKVENNGQIRSQAGTGLSADIRLTGHLYNDNPSSRLLTNGDISQFIFGGADDQLIDGGNATKNNFNKLRISKSNSSQKVTLFNDISIRKNIELATGDLNLQASKVYLTLLNTSNAPIHLAASNLDSFPSILNETENNRIYGDSYNAAVVIENQEIASPGNPFEDGPVNLGNMGAEIYDPENHFGAAQITIKRVHNTNSIVIDTGDPMNPLYMGSINRTYTIESNPDTPIPSEMDFTFRYLDGEVSGSEANLTIFKSDGSGGIWTAQSSILNTSANTLVQNDVADITKWWTAFPCTNAPYVFFYQSPETHLCDGVTYTLTPANTGGPASAYEWILDGDTLGLNEDHYSITGVEDTPNQTLEFIAYDSLGCYDRAIVTIVHEDTLIVDIGPNLALCQGASHTFTAAYPGNWKVDGIPQGNPQIPMSSFNFIANNYSPGPHAVTIAVYLNYCNAFDTVTVTVNPTPTVEITPPYSTVCEPGTTDLTANPTGGTTPYDYNWNYGGASTQTVSVPNATTVYYVTLTDDNGCTATDGMGMNFVNIILTETHTQPICFGEGLGSIDLTISTPNGCPGIIWSNGATTEDLTGLSAGTYTVTVTNASNGCTDTQFFDCSKTLSVTLVGPSAALETSSNVTNLLCHGDGNGLIDLVVSGGTPPYAYLWSNGAATQDINMLSGGAYGVTVTDANLCTATNSIVVFEPDPVGQPPFTPPTITSVTCNGAGDGAIAWTIEGGTAPYNFSWTGPGGFTATTEDLANLDGGTYNVTVTDANNCTYSTNMTVPEPAPLAAVVTPHNISCFGSSDGYIVISDPTGGTAPFEFDWTGPNGYTSTDQVIYSLEIGGYDLTITDANGCTLVPATLTISGPSTPLSFTATVTNVTCFGTNNGSISIAATGGWGGYTYSWLDPNDEDLPSLPVISSLAPGNCYSLILFDANGCDLQDCFIITEPGEIILNETVTNISCNGASDGSIFLNAAGGTGGFAYHWQWANGSSTASFIENLGGPTQSYSVTVTDATNCTKTATFQVVEPALISAASVVQNISCNGYDDGSINLNVSGGNPAYTFTWTGPGSFTSSDEDIFDLVPGVYAVTVSDVNNCDGPVLNFTITEPAQLTANPVITNPLDCFEDTDGQLNAGPMGGAPPYTYLWTYPDLSTTATTQFISNLSQPGNYSIEIFDAHGCYNFPAQVMIELTSPPEITASAIITPVTINGLSDGAIGLTVSGGTGGYTFLWSNGATTEDLTGIPAGSYTVTVTDGNSCEKTAAYVVDEPTLLEIIPEDLSNVSCNGANDGSILVSGEGGVSPYNFLWSNGDTDGEITNLAPGGYTLTLTDANGAVATATFTITETGPLAGNAVVVNAACFMSGDGSISLSPTGGAAPYFYNWSNGETTGSITGLLAGPYSVTITDSHDCEFLNTYTITEPDPLLTGSTPSAASCFGYNDGSIELTASGGTTPYAYNWDNGISTGTGTGTTLPNLFAGTYDITLTDANGCATSTTATVGQPVSFNPAVTGDPEICEGETSVLDAGTGFINYLWNTGETTQTISAATGGTYLVTITATGGCTETAGFTLTVEPLPTLTVNSVVCAPDLLSYEVEITTNGVSLTANFGTVTNNGSGSFTVSEIPAGQDVTLTAYSNFGNFPCLKIQTVTAPVCACPTVNAPVSSGNPSICLGETIPALTVTVGPNETADWYDAATGGNLLLSASTSYTPTTADTYYAEARNTTTNCVSITRTAVTLTIHPLPTAAAGDDVTICEGANTQLDAGSSTGSGALSFAWSPATGLSNPNIANPLATPTATTTYTVTVTDENTCSATDEVTVIVNPLPTADAGPDVTICAGASTQLDAGGSSGSGTLSYAWSPTAGLSDPNIANPVANPLGATTYTVTVTDGNGCTATGAVVVTVNPLPTLILNSALCAPDLLSYDVLVTSNAGTLTADYGLVVNNGNGTFSIGSVPPGQNVTLTATLTATGCQKTLVVTAPVCTCPVVQAPGNPVNQTLCFGETILPLTVTVSPDETADWYDAPAAGTLLLSGNTSYTPTGAATYYAEARNTTNNCVSTTRTAVTLTVNPLPTANAGADVSICAGANTQLDASSSSGSGTLTYAWSPATGLNNPNIANPLASPTATTTYTLTVTDDNFCSATDEVIVTVNPLPSAAAGADVTICAGANTQLDAGGSSGSGTLTYAWNPATGLNNPNIANPLASPTATTSYTVTVTDGNTCTATATVVVTVNPLPTLTLNSALCAPDLLTYDVLAASNADGLTADYGTATNTGNGTFTISGVPPGQDVTLTATLTATGCQQTLTVTAPDCSCPTVGAPGNPVNQTLCFGETILPLTVTVSPDETADWYDAPAAGNLLLAASTSYTPTAAATFYAEARNTINNCLSDTRTAVVLTINPLPVANAGADVAICAGANTQLNASGSTGSGALSYAWSPATGLNNPNIVNPVASPAATTTYTVTVTDDNFCSATAQVVVTVNPLPTLTINSATCAPDLLTYTVVVTTGGGNVTASAGAVTNNGGGSFTISGIPAGPDVTVTAIFSSTNCQVSQLVPAPDCSCPDIAAPISAGGPTICDSETIPALTVTVNVDETADWYDAATGGNLLQQGSTSFTPAGAATYYAEARNTINNCISATRTAVVLTIHPAPSANAGPGVTICSGESTQLDASGSSGNGTLTYAWSPVTGLNNPNIVNPVATPPSNYYTITYTVLVTDGNGCTATDQVTVSVNFLPTLTINSATCDLNLLTYTVLATSNSNTVTATAGTVTNNGNGAFTISGIPAGQNIAVTAIYPATGCQTTEPVIAPNCVCPVVQAPLSGGNAAICAGSPIPTLTVTVNAGETADWYDAATGGNLLLAGNTSYTPSPSGVGGSTFYAEARNTANGCASATRTAVILTIHPLPTANAGAGVAICFGTNTTLDGSASTGSGTLTFLWSPPTGLDNPNIANPVANPTATTAYTLQVTALGGCPATDQIVVTVNPLPTLSVGSATCAPDLLTYQVSVTTPADQVTANFGTVVSNGGGSFTITGIPAGQNIVITATITASGCQKTQGVNAPDCNCPTVAAPLSTGDAEICAGATIPTLTVTVNTGETADWYDAPSGGNLLLAGNTSYTPTAAATFYAEARELTSNCTSTTRTAVVLTINPLPSAMAGADVTICFGTNTTLSAGGSTGSGALTFVWAPATGLSDPNIVNPVASPADTTTYTVTVTDDNGCTASDAVTVAVDEAPSAMAGADVAICAGNSTTLDAGGSTGNGTLSFAWSPAAGLSNPNIANPLASPASTTTYTVAVTDGNGCTATDQVTVAILALPSAMAGADVAICAGASTQLDAGGSTGSGTLSFLWSPATGLSDPNIANPTANPVNTVTYTVQVTGGNGCDASDPVTVTVNNLPFANAGADVTICAGSSTTLNAGGSTGSGVLTYAWSPAAGLSNPNIANPVANPSATTPYTVTVTDGNGCGSTDQLTVTVNPFPILSVNSTMCAPNLLTYSVSITTTGSAVTASAGTVTNNGGGVFTISGVPAGQNVNITAGFPGSSCQTSQLVTAPVCTCPVVQAPGNPINQTICANTPIPALTVTVNPGETADWYNAPTGGALLLAGNTSFTPPGLGTFYAQARNTINSCVSATRTAVILTINPLPVANAGASAAICFGTNTTLNAGGSTGLAPLSFSWSPTAGLSNPNIANPVASPAATTTYTILVTDGNGCTATAQVVVTVNPLPTLAAGSPVCAPNLLTYSVAVTSNGTVTATLGTVTSNGGNAYTISGVPTGQNVTVTATLPATGCQRTLNVTSPACPCPVVNAPGNPVSQTICAGSPVPALTVTVGANQTADWYDAAAGGNLLLAGNTSYTPSPSGAGGWTYYAEARNTINNCVSNSRTAVALTVNPVPAANAGADAAICFGTNTTLNAGGSTGLAPLSFSWTPTAGLSNPNLANPVASPAATTTYAVLVTNGLGCTDSDEVLVTVNNPPVANAGPDVAICTGSGTTLNAGNSTGNGPFTFAWSPGTGLSATNIANPTASPTATTTYTVTVTGSGGCSATDQVTVTVNPLPVITVNNVLCDPGLLTYYVLVTTNGNSVTTTEGTVSNQGGGSFLINNVPTGTNITITASFAATGCPKPQGVNSPNCNCPPISPPVSGGNQAICIGQTIPALTVTVNAGETASWYDAPTGGIQIISGVTSYTPAGAGTFYVEALNTTSNCTSTTRTPVALTVNPLPVANAGADVTTCSGMGVQLDASGSSGSGGLAFSWSPPAGLNNPNIVNPIANPTVATTYTVVVTNAVGCSSSDEVLVSVGALPSLGINVPVCSPDLLTYSVGVSTNGNSLTANYGTVTNNGGGSFSISGVPAGQDLTLTVTLTATGCQLTQVLPAPDCNCPVVETPLSNGDLEICENEPIPTLSVTVNAGETADWYDAPVGGDLLLANSTSYTPSPSGAGGATYYAEARIAASGCASDDRVAVELDIHPLPAVVFNDPADVCGGSLPVVLSASPTGGIFSGPGVAGNQFDPVAAGVGLHVLTYSFTNVNGCSGSASQNIEVLAVPAVLAGSNSPVCDGSDLELTESGAGGAAWAWTGPDGFVSSEQHPVLTAPTAGSAGTYEVIVTNAAGCTQSASVAVALNPALGLNLSPDPAAFCPGGEVQLVATASGGSGGFDYAWTTPAGSASGQAVAADEAGTWSVTATDGSGCTIAGSVAVSELPAIAVDFTSANASCNSSDGTLTGSVAGGVPPYAYQWDGLPNTTNLLTGVPAGSYQVIVTDDAGCVFTATGIVGNTDAPVVSLNNLVDVACAGAATGSVTVDVSGGSLPYTFNWSNGATTQNLSGLTAGQYALEVVDAAGCIVNEIYPVDEPAAITGILIQTQTSGPAASDGTIDLTVSGGVPPYQFAWSNGLNSEDIASLFIGPYSVTITDASGCSVVENTTVTAIGALAVNLLGQNISCNGSGDGSVEVEITGGVMPYAILWSTGSNLTMIDNLAPGSYQVTVTGQNGSTASASVNLTQPAVLQAFTQMTGNQCNGASAGTANVIASGGTTPYTFEWSNGQTTQAINNLMAGDYTVTVTDANGCTNVKTATVGEPTAMLINVDGVTGNDCFGQTQGAIGISVSGGAFPYFANWSNSATTQDISGLAAGAYTVTITDFQTCTATTSVMVDEPSQIVISFDNTAVTCFGEANGSLTANVAGGTPGTTGYLFNWASGETTAVIGNLVSDNYFVTITDEAGCTSAGNDFVAQPAVLLGNLTATNITCFGLANGAAEVQPSGGTMPYGYSWNSGASGTSIEDLAVGAYSVTITDVAGCTATETLQITQPDELLATSTVTDLNCFNDFTGAIDLAVSGGTPLPSGKYITSWSSGQFTEDIGQLAAGDYTVSIVDKNGCAIQETITVTEPDAIVAQQTINNVSCYGGNDGSVSLTAAGGIEPYVFNWENGAATPGITGLSAGSYTGAVTDDHGCTLSTESEITQPDFLSMEYQIQRAGCKSPNDGGIDITVEGGVPAYTFNWSNGAVSEDASQLTAGTYAVTATDDHGCTVSQSLAVASSGGTFEAHFLAASGLFDVDSVEVNPDDIIQFVDVSYPSPLSWEWSFGDPDSTTSDVRNPAFSYPNDESVHQSSYWATLTASNLYCTDSMTKRIWITNNMRLNAPQKDTLTYLTFTEVLAWPNPTTGWVTLDIQLSREETVRLIVVDVLGEILEQNKLEGADHYSTKLDFTDWTPGLYFIILRSVNQVHTVKIVVSEE